MALTGDGGIFISYRRQESSHLAGRLYDRLAAHFGEDQVFIDVNTIEPGVDFTEEIFRAVAACKVLLAIIGPAWLSAADERGSRRLDDPDDVVRLEIQAALARSVRVIPILIDGAVMPTRQSLPESLADLARRNALPIRHDSFHLDVERLITAIERVLAVPGTAAPSAPRADADVLAASHDARADVGVHGQTVQTDPEAATERHGMQATERVDKQTVESVVDEIYSDEKRRRRVIGKLEERGDIKRAPENRIERLPAPRGAADLALVTEDDATPRRNPSMELIKQTAAQLTLPNEGNGFLIIDREDQFYAQAARNGANDYQVEYRDGDATRHFAAYHVTLAEAQAALCGWAFDLPGWRDRLQWTRESL